MRTTTVASLGKMPSESVLADLDRRVDLVEVRADLIGDDRAWSVAQSFGPRLIYTLRSREQGGQWEGDTEERRSTQARAAALGCLVDLELDRDEDPATLGAVPEAQRLWSWHGPFVGVQRLRGRLSAMTALGGCRYKLVPEAGSQADVLAVLEWMSTQPANVIGFASGAMAGWGRILAARFGAGWVYLSVDTPTAEGQISLDRWFADGYSDASEAPSQISGVVGSPAGHSLSPRIHNAAYRHLDLDHLYLPFEVPDFADFWLEVVESESWPELQCELVGLSVTAPHKRVALAVAGASSPLAAYVGAANTLVQDRGVWEAEMTDPDGIRLPLEERGVDPRGTSAAVLGAGGAGRAAVVALQQAGARVAVVNRGLERGMRVAERFQADFVPLEEFHPGGYEIVVHATSVGRDGEEPPFEVADLAQGTCVIDMVYRTAHDGEEGGETKLVRKARERGLVVVGGREVLLAQARLQFQMMTGHELPQEVVRQALGMVER